MGRKKLALAGVVIALGVAAAAAYAALPSRDVNPSSVPLGTLAGGTPVNVLSVDSFTRAINQAHGTNAVLQHLHFIPGRSTGWHTHPGPNIVLVVSGSLTLTDEHCNVTTYGDGQGFATGIDVHQAVAGPNGADFYSLYFLPKDADVLRTDAGPPICAGHTNAGADHGNSGADHGNSGADHGKSASAPGHNK
jgi:quercetin dioxygenase-like cupin family protein